MELKDYEHGQLLRDSITGFTGIGTAVTDFFNGCIHVILEGKQDSEKLPRHSFDIQTLELVPETAETAAAIADAQHVAEIAKPSRVKKRKLKKEKKGEVVRTGGPREDLSVAL